MKNSLRVVIVFLTFFALACSPKDQTSTLKEAEASISEATFSPDMFVAIPEIVGKNISLYQTAYPSCDSPSACSIKLPNGDHLQVNNLEGYFNTFDGPIKITGFEFDQSPSSPEFNGSGTPIVWNDGEGNSQPAPQEQGDSGRNNGFNNPLNSDLTDSIVVTNDDRIAAARRWIEEGRNDIEQFKGSYNDAQPSSPTASADAASKAIDEHQAQNNADIEAGIARANDTFQQALASFVGAIQVYYTALARTYNDNKNVRDRAEEAAQKNTDSSTQKLDQINFGTANSRLNELDSLLAKVKNERNEIGARIVRNLPIVPARYDRFKSSPTSYIGQQIRQNLINIESMRKAASSLTVEQNDYLAKADNLLHIVDLEGGSTPDHDLNNRIIVARQLIDLAAGRNVDWKADSAKKIECEGKTISERDRNRLRTSEYAKLYISDPDSFKWPGMAAYASDLVGFGIDVGGFLKHYPDYAGVVQETGKFMAEGNAAVFNDIYWQFDAYSAGGIEEIKRLAEVQELTDDQLKAWLVIDDGRKTGDQEQVWLGNELLLRYEQFVTLQPIYKQYSDLSLLLSPFMISPIPGDMEIFQIEVPGGNVGNRDDRWSWITKSMLPAYRKLSDQNRNKATSDLSNLIIDSAGVCK